MSQTITMKGAVKFSMKKLVTGSEIATSEYRGPGEVLFAPPFLGDITSLRLFGKEEWKVGKDAFLAATVGVTKDTKRQALGKAVFSGEGLFTYNISGSGYVWISSFGAIVRKDVSCFFARPIELGRGRVLLRHRHTDLNGSFNHMSNTSSTTAT